MNKNIAERLKQLRAGMRTAGVDVYIVNGTDPHQSEYVCPRWRTRAWISGFTGSAGTVVVTKTEALLWVDSRYFIQAAEEIAGTGFTLMKTGWEKTPTPLEWIVAHVKKGRKVGIDEETLSVKDEKKIEAAFGPAGISLVTLPDLLGAIWTDRPPVPDSKLVPMLVKYAGVNRTQKLADVRAKMAEESCSYYLISSLDDIAWVTNLRGSDVAHNPVFLSYLLIGPERAWLFTDISRFSADLLKDVRTDMDVMPYEMAAKKIASLVRARDSIYLNPARTNTLMMKAVSRAKKIVMGEDFTTIMKASKNPVELDGMRKAHVADGVAMVNFLASLDYQKPDYDEYEIETMVDKSRLRNPECLDTSFGTIAGWGPNGAMCHYQATAEVKAKIKGNGLLVLDSGGQYLYGTTDITRTLLFGLPTAEQKRDYTLTLKGHLALERAVFPEGTRGYQLDILAKQFMWQKGMTFYHGTGHGVGCRLNVHEGPFRINGTPCDVPIGQGAVVSDEPGIYKEGRHGVRIENLLAVVPAKKTEFGQFYKFEVLTLCPYERRLIDKKLLTQEETEQIDTYHQRVWEALKDNVDPSARDWLRRACARL